ncbi:FG-GAP repeat domain-containing protein [Ilyomonas limi]|nr:VCBS repeat-containing protein [Ilyomonas limi]
MIKAIKSICLPYCDMQCYIILLFIISIIPSYTACAQGSAAKSSTVQFKKHVISPVFVAEGAAVGDVNSDGALDIVAGNYWFEAPQWRRHLLHADTLNPVPGYSTTFLNFCMDVNNDGWVDVIRFDEPGGICVWYENPGKDQKLWTGHTILLHAGIETPLLADVDNDGRMDILCNDAAAKQVIWLKAPVVKGDTTWQRYVISHDSTRATDRYTHGLGWGDVNKDGRNDVIIKSGWWESPVNVKNSDWAFHAANLGEDCANMFAMDVDKDGDQDILSSSAHNYGIWWHEQLKDNAGNISWKMHEISKLFSQSHALALEDINGDGNPDLITGKRYLAHQDAHDPGSHEPAVLYWFEYIPGKNAQWIPHQIDDDSGIGNRFVVMDMNGDKLPDIVVSNKKGVFFFEQVKSR